MPILAAQAPAPVARSVEFTVTDPATGEETTVSGSYLVQPQPA